MRSPLRTQIFWPIAGLLLLSVLLLTGISTWYAAVNSERQTRQHLQAVTDALGDASYPLTPEVVRRIGAMIGGDLVVCDADGHITTSTIAETESLSSMLAEVPLTDDESASPQLVRWNAQVYLISAIRRTYVQRPGTLYLMLPTDEFSLLLRHAVLPPLAAIVPFLILAVGVALVISRRIAGRVDQVRELFKRLASGDFQPVPASGRDDEIHDLMVSANELSEQLRAMQDHLVASERLQLLGQLSGGLAHQLRNSITGARLAVQLHQRNCTANDRMLDTAVSQLNLTEEQVLAVISLRPDSEGDPVPAETDLCELVREVADLLQPLCSHWKSTLSLELTAPVSIPLISPRSVRGALLNLIQNAVESAGVNGCVTVRTSCSDHKAAVMILDSGPGFPDSGVPLTEAFQTTKPDGIGLGLTIAQHAVDQECGQLMIDRVEQQTVVTLELPLQKNREFSRSVL